MLAAVTFAATSLADATAHGAAALRRASTEPHAVDQEGMTNLLRATDGAVFIPEAIKKKLTDRIMDYGRKLCSKDRLKLIPACRKFVDVPEEDGPGDNSTGASSGGSSGASSEASSEGSSEDSPEAPPASSTEASQDSPESPPKPSATTDSPGHAVQPSSESVPEPSLEHDPEKDYIYDDVPTKAATGTTPEPVRNLTAHELDYVHDGPYEDMPTNASVPSVEAPSSGNETEPGETKGAEGATAGAEPKAVESSEKAPREVESTEAEEGSAARDSNAAGDEPQEHTRSAAWRTARVGDLVVATTLACWLAARW